jgi:solute carrier family 25 (mitochondrial carnitine/acylcarnitine transporter), member 20/29
MSDQAAWDRVRHFIGGYFSGMALVLAGHPFDTIKVRLQAEGKSGKFSGPLNCLVKTIQNEGFRGLYKGVTPPLLATGVVNSCLFGLQGLTIHSIQKYRGQTDRPPEIAEIAGSAIFTGFLISFLVTPMEGVKARLQV